MPVLLLGWDQYANSAFHQGLETLEQTGRRRCFTGTFAHSNLNRFSHGVWKAASVLTDTSKKRDNVHTPYTSQRTLTMFFESCGAPLITPTNTVIVLWLTLCLNSILYATYSKGKRNLFLIRPSVRFNSFF